MTGQDRRSLPWLGAAEQHTRGRNSLWSGFRQDLQSLLGDVEVSNSLILNVATELEGSDEAILGRYLQYELRRVDGDLFLIAEVSAAKYQPAVVQHGPHVTHEFVQRGWPIDVSGGNHQRTVPWPDGIAATVDASLEVLCDVWQVPHPSAVSIEMHHLQQPSPTPGPPSQDPDVISPSSLAESLIVISGWVTDTWGIECGLISESDQKVAAITLTFNDVDMMIAGPDQASVLEYTTIVTNDPALASWLTPEIWNAVIDEYAVAGRARLQDGSLLLTCAVPSPVLVRDNAIEQIKYWTELATGLAKQLRALHSVADTEPGNDQ